MKIIWDITSRRGSQEANLYSINIMFNSISFIYSNYEDYHRVRRVTRGQLAQYQYYVQCYFLHTYKLWGISIYHGSLFDFLAWHHADCGYLRWASYKWHFQSSSEESYREIKNEIQCFWDRNFTEAPTTCLKNLLLWTVTKCCWYCFVYICPVVHLVVVFPVVIWRLDLRCSSIYGYPWKWQRTPHPQLPPTPTTSPHLPPQPPPPSSSEFIRMPPPKKKPFPLTYWIFPQQFSQQFR